MYCGVGMCIYQYQVGPNYMYQNQAHVFKKPPIWTLGGSKIWPHGALLGSKRGSEIDSEANQNSMGYGGVPGGQGGGTPLWGA